MLFSLNGKTILVTGASSGIGRSIAILCSACGANLVLTGRNVQGLQETKSLLHGANHQIISADLTDFKQRNMLSDNVEELNGVVHCAGIGSRVLCKLLSEKDIIDVMSANFEAPVLLQSELLSKKKISRNSSIVFISSMSSKMPSIGNAIYSASKAAIIAYAKCLSLELASRKIRVNCVSPAMVWTKLAMVGATEEQLKVLENNYPLGRYGKPEDIAPIVVYLLSDEAAWVTGSNMEITGGTQSL